MSRANKRDTEIRAALETISAEVAVTRKMMIVTRLRVEQARDRTGLDALLCPALDEIDEVNKAVTMIGQQVSVALRKLEQG
jgi:division protein CdvB (Snf7/Vps24/ESCRT-III family)